MRISLLKVIRRGSTTANLFVDASFIIRDLTCHLCVKLGLEVRREPGLTLTSFLVVVVRSCLLNRAVRRRL